MQPQTHMVHSRLFRVHSFNIMPAHWSFGQRWSSQGVTLRQGVPEPARIACRCRCQIAPVSLKARLLYAQAKGIVRAIANLQIVQPCTLKVSTVHSSNTRDSCSCSSAVSPLCAHWHWCSVGCML